MSDEKKETWLNWLAVTTILFSACATLSTFKGGGFSNRAILAQANASDQWSFYQAKSVKQHTFELARDDLGLQLLSVKDSTVAHAFQAKIASYSSDVARYQADKDKAMNDAKAFVSDREDYQKHGARFAEAVVYLQVAIVFSALAALMKKKLLWLLGSASGSVGLVYFLTGLFWTVVK